MIKIVLFESFLCLSSSRNFPESAKYQIPSLSPLENAQRARSPKFFAGLASDRQWGATLAFEDSPQALPRGAANPTPKPSGCTAGAASNDPNYYKNSTNWQGLFEDEAHIDNANPRLLHLLEKQGF
jgi:hypothetical protein